MQLDSLLCLSSRSQAKWGFYAKASRPVVYSPGRTCRLCGHECLPPWSHTAQRRL